MGRKVNNPRLGEITCETCHQLATVHQQSKGKARYLYTKGCDCKYNASTGAVRQSKLWHETKWDEGANPIKPPNVADDSGAADFDPDEQKHSKPADAGQPSPAAPAAGDTETEAPEPAGGDEKGSGGLGKVLGVISLAGLGLLALVMRR